MTALSPGADTPAYPCGGQIQFYLNDAPLGQPVYYCGGYSSVAVSDPAFLPLVGDKKVTAQYSRTSTSGSDPNFLNSAVSTPGMFHTVNPLAPTVALESTPGPTSNYGDALILTATVSGPPGAPTGGTVNFAAQPASGAAISLGSATLTNGEASINVTSILNAGSYTLQAAFVSSDTNFTDTSGSAAQIRWRYDEER